MLLNLGGPDSLEAVRPFLFNLFSDREIIRLGPPFMQKPLAHLIAALRHRKTEGFYTQIGGKSPIREITLAQANALQQRLKANPGGSEFNVYVGMRYWRPFIEEIVPSIQKDGITNLIALNLYPQYSVATTGSSLSKLKEVLSGRPVEIYPVTSWYTNPFYIDALVENIKRGFESFQIDSEGGIDPASDIHVLFSAHSLPVKFIEEGDPYLDQVRGTINEVAKKIEMRWHLSFQSKSGPVKWLEPSTDKMLEDLARKNVRNLLVVPISFVSDHIETLYEIDILYKKMAVSLGIRLQRTESLNTSALFIAALEDLVMSALRDSGWA